MRFCPMAALSSTTGMPSLPSVAPGPTPLRISSAGEWIAPDDTLGFVAANGLNPYKSRVLLMLALAAGATGPVVLQRAFDTY